MLRFQNYRDCGYTCNPHIFEIHALRFPCRVPVIPCKHLQCSILREFELQPCPADIWSGKIVSFHIIYVVSCMPNLWLVLRPCLYLILVVAQWIKQRPYVGRFICTLTSWVSSSHSAYGATSTESKLYVDSKNVSKKFFHCSALLLLRNGKSPFPKLCSLQTNIFGRKQGGEYQKRFRQSVSA